MAVQADAVTVELIAKTDGYTAKVNEAAAATEKAMGRVAASATQAENVIQLSAGRIANGQRNLGRQFADVGASLSSGSSPFVVAAQQLPQIADALTDVGGKAGAFAAVLSGPVGAAALAVGSILATTLLPKLLDTGVSVDDLVKKLQDNATKATAAATAQRIFDGSLQGALIASQKLTGQLEQQNKSQLQVAQSALAAASAQRQLAINTIKTESSRIALAQSDLQNQRKIAAVGGGNLRDTGANANIADLDRKIASGREKLAVANQLLASAQKGVVEASVPLLKLQAADLSDKSAAATTRHTKAVDGLTNAYRRQQAAADALDRKNGVGAGNALRAKAEAEFRSGVASSDTQLTADQQAIRDANKKGPRGAKGPSADTLARRAEAERVKGVRDQEAFDTQNEQLNLALLQAARARVVDIQALAGFAREEVATELRKRLVAIDADESAKKINAAQAEELRAAARGVAVVKNININQDERQKLADRNNAVAVALLNNQQDVLQAQLGLAENSDQRREIEQKLLDLKYKELIAAQEKARDDAIAKGDVASALIAGGNIQSLQQRQGLEQNKLNNDNRGSYATYRKQIQGDFTTTKETVEGIEVQALDAVTNSLTQAATAALGLKGALGDVVGQIIKIGIQRRLIGPLADALFGKADGSTSGAAGNFLTSLFSKIGGRASGGNVTAGNIYKINENGPELFQPSQSGKIYPTGSLQAKGGMGGGTVVIAPQQFDLRGVVMTEALVGQLESRNRQYADAVAARAGRTAYQSSPARSARLQTLGT